jgi:sigma-B regulation protein RsbU (phosphoserine phosphatase)
MAATLWTDVDALARLARSEHSAANSTKAGHALQYSVRPGEALSFPEGPEFALHALSAPARIVAGDYFDFFFVAEDTMVVVMADVSGKGIPAALLMGVTRSVLRNVSADSASPGATLSRVNKILYDAELGAMFVTIFLGWYNTRTGMLRYANAGHPRPYRLKIGGGIAQVGEVTGPILGILDVKTYGEAEERLAPGERLVLYTDGVTEARNPAGDFFGHARLEGLLQRVASEPVDRMCQLVAREVELFQDGQRQDDATLLALLRKA